MRVAIVLLVCGLACVLLLYWPKGRGEDAQERFVERAPAVEPSPPRLGVALADPNLKPAVVAKLAAQTVDAGHDSGLSALDEASLNQQIRDLMVSDPKRAEALAREGRRRFPDSPLADERDFLLVGTMYNQRDLGLARIEGSYYFEHHAPGRFVDSVAHLLHVTPPPAAGKP